MYNKIFIYQKVYKANNREKCQWTLHIITAYLTNKLGYKEIKINKYRYVM